MTSFDESIPAPSATFGVDPLRVAIAAYLARYKGATRLHTESDLRIYLTWCAERDLEPLTARRHQVELYVRWLQEVRPVRSVDGVTSAVGGRRLLPDLRHRRHSGTLAC